MATSIVAKIAALSPEAQQRAGAREGVSVDQVMASWSDERRACVEARARKLIDEASNMQAPSRAAATPPKP